jgi:protein-disulfide isomerase
MLNPLSKDSGRQFLFEQDSEYKKIKEESFRKFINSSYSQKLEKKGFLKSFVPLFTFVKTQTVAAMIGFLLLSCTVSAGGFEIFAPKPFKPSKIIDSVINPYEKPTSNNSSGIQKSASSSTVSSNQSSASSSSSSTQELRGLEPDTSNSVVNMEECDISIKYPKVYIPVIDYKDEFVRYRFDTQEKTAQKAQSIYIQCNKSGAKAGGASSCIPDSLPKNFPYTFERFPEEVKNKNMSFCHSLSPYTGGQAPFMNGVFNEYVFSFFPIYSTEDKIYNIKIDEKSPHDLNKFQIQLNSVAKSKADTTALADPEQEEEEKLVSASLSASASISARSVEPTIENKDTITLKDFEGNVTFGNGDSRLVLRVLDYQAPAAKLFFKDDDKVTRDSGLQANINFVYVISPLTDIHPNSLSISEAAQAMAAQGKSYFFEYSKALFANQNNLNEQKITELAKEIAPDFERWKTDRKSQKVKNIIAKNQEFMKDFYKNHNGNQAALPANVMIKNGKIVGNTVGNVPFEVQIRRIKEKMSVANRDG